MTLLLVPCALCGRPALEGRDYCEKCLPKKQSEAMRRQVQQTSFDDARRGFAPVVKTHRAEEVMPIMVNGKVRAYKAVCACGWVTKWMTQNGAIDALTDHLARAGVR